MLPSSVATQLINGASVDASKFYNTELGLATEVVPADSLMQEALHLAKKVAALPPQAVQDTKSVLNQHLRAAAVTSLHFGLAAESQSHDTVEYRAVPETFRSRKE